MATGINLHFLKSKVEQMDIYGLSWKEENKPSVGWHHLCQTMPKHLYQDVHPYLNFIENYYHKCMWYVTFFFLLNNFEQKKLRSSIIELFKFDQNYN